MSARPRPIRSRARRLLSTGLSAGLSLGLALGAAGALVVADRGPLASDAALAAAPAAATQPPGPTRFRVSTFNLLGYGHTMKGGDRKGFADGVTRQQMADQLIRANGLEVVGFQEMEQPQIDQFNRELGAQYDLFPGSSYQGKSSVNVRGNSIAWRKDRWTALSRTYYDAPYFKGVNVPRPIVLLRNRV